MRIYDTSAARYSEKRKPSVNAVIKIIQNFKNWLKRKLEKLKPITDNTEIKIAWLGYFAAYPTFLRQFALESGLSN